MNYLSENITYKKKSGKLIEVIEREVDVNSLDKEIVETQNAKDKNEEKITLLQSIKNT